MRSLGDFSQPPAGISSRDAYIRSVLFRLRHRRRSARVGGFLLRKSGGGDQGHLSIGTRGRGQLTVQHPGQRVSVNAPSAADAAGKARGDATPSRYGLHGYANKRRRLPRGVVRPFDHHQHRMVAAMAKRLRHYAARQSVLSSCVNASARAFCLLEVPRPENPPPRLMDRPACPPPQGTRGPFRLSGQTGRAWAPILPFVSTTPLCHILFGGGKPRDFVPYNFGQATSRPMRCTVRFVLPSWENRVRLRWRKGARINDG